MRHSTASTSLLTFSVAFFATQAGARVQFLDLDWDDVELGEPFTLRWEGQGDEGVNLWLNQDQAQNLRRVRKLGSDDPALSGIAWTVTLRDLPDGDYAFEIEDVQSGDVNYSEIFEVGDGGGDDDDASTTRSFLPPLTTLTTSTTISEETAQSEATTSTGENAESDAESTRGSQTTAQPSSTPGSEEDNATTTSSGTQESGTPSSGSSSDGLSAGAKAGIGVGAGLGGLLIILLVAWFFYRKGQQARSKRRPGLAATELALGDEKQAAGEWPKTAAELNGNEIAEMPDNDYGTSAKPSELPSPDTPFAEGEGRVHQGQITGRSELQ